MFTERGLEVPGTRLSRIYGSIPTWLEGTLYRNGPGNFDGLRHLFDGYSLLQAIRIRQRGGEGERESGMSSPTLPQEKESSVSTRASNSSSSTSKLTEVQGIPPTKTFESQKHATACVTYTSRFLQSRSYRDAMSAGRPMHREFGTEPASTLLGRLWTLAKGDTATDNANVHVFPLRGELLAMTEAPHAWRVGKNDLSTRGMWPGAPFSEAPFGQVACITSTHIMRHEGETGGLRVVGMHREEGEALGEMAISLSLRFILRPSLPWGIALRCFYDLAIFPTSTRAQRRRLGRGDRSASATRGTCSAHLAEEGEKGGRREGIHQVEVVGEETLTPSTDAEAAEELRRETVVHRIPVEEGQEGAQGSILPCYQHSFSVTRHYAILMEAPLRFSLPALVSTVLCPASYPEVPPVTDMFVWEGRGKLRPLEEDGEGWSKGKDATASSYASRTPNSSASSSVSSEPSLPLETSPHVPTYFRVIKLATGEQIARIEAPRGEAFFVFHHINAFEKGRTETAADGASPPPQTETAAPDLIYVDLIAYADASIIHDLFLDRIRGESASRGRGQAAAAAANQTSSSSSTLPSPTSPPPQKSCLRRFEIDLVSKKARECCLNAQATSQAGASSTSSLLSAEPSSAGDAVPPAVLPEPLTNFELPCIAPAFSGKEHHYAYAATAGALGGLLVDGLVKIDYRTGAAYRWKQEGCIPSEPIFVARPHTMSDGSVEEMEEDDGVLLSLVTAPTYAAACKYGGGDVEARGGSASASLMPTLLAGPLSEPTSFLLILDAGRGGKPLREIARVPLPVGVAVPMTFHGSWCNAGEDTDEREY